MSDKPFFSIVLPTYNRADLLPFSIKSILNQTFGDFELVISNNNSSDNTEQVIHSFNDPRIRYFKTEKLLPVLDNWNFALSQARGEYVTFIGDDDANSVAAFELIKQTLNENPNCLLLGWQMCDYYLETYQAPEGKIAENSLGFIPFTGKLLKKDARQFIQDIFASDGLTNNFQNNTKYTELPSLVNAVYHRSLVSKLNKTKYFFHPSCLANDRYNAIVTLNEVTDFFYLDYPLHLHGFSPRSGTATIATARKSFQKSSEQLLTKFNCLTYRNYSANALLHAKADLGADLNYIKIDEMRFFVETFKDLLLLKRQGFDIDDDLKSFRQALLEQPPEFQKEFEGFFSSNLRRVFDYILYHLKTSLRPSYYALGLAEVVAKSGLNQDATGRILLTGKTEGFTNISECAQMMSKDWLGNNRQYD